VIVGLPLYGVVKEFVRLLDLPKARGSIWFLARVRVIETSQLAIGLFEAALVGFGRDA
jgi:hypothetical protein